MTNYIVLTDKDAIKLGIVTADGADLEWTATVDDLRAVMCGERLQRYQAEELALECGGGWVIDPEGNATWQDAS